MKNIQSQLSEYFGRLPGPYRESYIKLKILQKCQNYDQMTYQLLNQLIPWMPVFNPVSLSQVYIPSPQPKNFTQCCSNILYTDTPRHKSYFTETCTKTTKNVNKKRKHRKASGHFYKYPWACKEFILLKLPKISTEQERKVHNPRLVREIFFQSPIPITPLQITLKIKSQVSMKSQS